MQKCDVYGMPSLFFFLPCTCTDVKTWTSASTALPHVKPGKICRSLLAFHYEGGGWKLSGENMVSEHNYVLLTKQGEGYLPRRRSSGTTEAWWWEWHTRRETWRPEPWWRCSWHSRRTSKWSRRTSERGCTH